MRECVRGHFTGRESTCTRFSDYLSKYMKVPTWGLLIEVVAKITNGYLYCIFYITVFVKGQFLEQSVTAALADKSKRRSRALL